MDISIINSKLDIILGTMFSGKTTYLLSKISLYSDLNFKIIYINIDIDNRSENSFSTHNSFMNITEKMNNEKFINNVTMIKTKSLNEINVEPYDIVIVDESHFFEDLVNFTKSTIKKNKYIIISSLIADFKGNKFGDALELIPICDNVIRLHAYCSLCAKNKLCKIAIYSKKITDSDDHIDIGGSEKYISVCREHYL